MALACPSRVARVVLHARGARVEREVELPGALPPGPLELTVQGLPLQALAGSVRARISGTRELVAVRTAVSIPDGVATRSELESAVRRARAELDEARARHERLVGRRDELLAADLKPKVREGRHTGEAELASARLGDALATARLVDRLSDGLEARIDEATRALPALERELQRLALGLRQAEAEQRAHSATPTRTVTVALAGEGVLQTLVVTYAVGAARWWPRYALRLSHDALQAELSVEAQAVQYAGEAWRDARFGFSSAELWHDARLPELPALRLGRAQPKPKRAFRPPPEGLDRLFEGWSATFGGLPQPPAEQEEPMDFEALSSPADEDAPISGAFAQGVNLEALDALGDGSEADEGGRSEEGAAPPPRSMAPMTHRATIPPSPRSRPAPTMASVSMASPPMEMAAPPMAKKASAAPLGGSAAPSPSLDEELPPYVPGSAMPMVSFGRSRGGRRALPEPVPREEPADGWLDFDALELEGPGNPGTQGRLQRKAEADQGGASAAQMLEMLSNGPFTDPRSSRGHFDHRWEANAPLDLPSDASPRRLELSRAQAPSRARFRSVPREEPAFFREVWLQNPHPTPLLDGPVDVFLDGNLITTSKLNRVGAGGMLRIGLGKEDRLRIARNVVVKEESAGLLGGSVSVLHEVTLDIVSSLGGPAELEVVERLPRSDEKAVEVIRVRANPEPEAYDQAERGAPLKAGLRWVFTLEPGGKRTLQVAYRITFSSKDELVGGNRRE